MGSKLFIYVSLVIDLLIAVFKFIAAGFTGSPSIASEGVHSLIDAVSQVLLLWGIKTSKKEPDEQRPFGYGKELYFWSFIVSLILFILGGCISFYEGIRQFQHPTSDGNINWNYAVLAFAFVCTFVSLYTSLRAFNRQRGELSFFKAIIKTKDPSTIIVLLGDVGDVLGLIIAFGGIYLSHRYHNPYIDGVASVIIGVMLIIISGLLLRESKSLLMGEATSSKTMRSIVQITEQDEAVVKVKKNFSMYLAPDEVLLHLNTIFKDNLTTKQITDANERIARSIQQQFPLIRQIFIEPVKP